MNQSLNGTANSIFGCGNSFSLERSLILNNNKKKYKQSILWGTINIIILAIVLYDLSYTCPLYTSYVQYAEYTLSVILCLNIFYYLFQFIRFGFQTDTPIIATTTKPIVLSDSLNFSNISLNNCTPKKYITLNNSYPNPTIQSTNTSRNETQNYSTIASPMSFNKSPQGQSSPVTSSHRNTSDLDYLNDEKSLNQYMKDYQSQEKSFNTSNPVEQPFNFLNTFWNYPINKTLGEISPLLKRCQYQLSSQTPTSSSTSPTSDDKCSPTQTIDTWKSLNVDSVALTQWNANLRLWLSQTILDRLTAEITSIERSLHETYGLTDVSIGSVGLDRLRKTAKLVPTLPSLATLVPFLEVTPNQQYLVGRLRKLARGGAGCMSEYKWNGGGVGFKDEVVPTDAEIIMHLFASYLDTQLMPQPNKPDLKPFSSFHYVKLNDKLPQLTKSTLAIQQISKYPPHYRVIIGEIIYEMVKGYNNLFHSILLFLYHVHRKEHGVLGRVNLGKAGVNMLWIINSD